MYVNYQLLLLMHIRNSVIYYFIILMQYEFYFTGILLFQDFIHQVWNDFYQQGTNHMWFPKPYRFCFLVAQGEDFAFKQTRVQFPSISGLGYVYDYYIAPFIVRQTSEINIIFIISETFLSLLLIFAFLGNRDISIFLCSRVFLELTS